MFVCLKDSVKILAYIYTNHNYIITQFEACFQEQIMKDCNRQNSLFEMGIKKDKIKFVCYSCFVATYKKDR